MFIFADGGVRGVKKLVIFCGRYKWTTPNIILITLTITIVYFACRVQVFAFQTKQKIQFLLFQLIANQNWLSVNSWNFPIKSFDLASFFHNEVIHLKTVVQLQISTEG